MTSVRSVAIRELGAFIGGRRVQRLLEHPSAPRVVGVDLRHPAMLEGDRELETLGVIRKRLSCNT